MVESGGLLANVHIILVGTTHPGNIGATARAMKTMGLQRLTLAATAAPFPNAEATAMASGADDLLMAARRVDSLEEAVADCRLVVATSARRRHLAYPVLTPAECARELLTLAQRGRVALVFGRERTGLSNDELDRCQRLVHIPTAPDYSSLNLAAAVQVMSYELFAHYCRWRSAAEEAPQRTDSPLACAEEIERFYQHLAKVLELIGFLKPHQPRQLLRRLRRLFNRAQLEEHEVNILRGILTAVEKHSATPAAAHQAVAPPQQCGEPAKHGPGEYDSN